MSKDARQSTGLVQAATKNLAPGGTPGGPVVDMQDLLPVIQSFQDHMAAEQARQRDRIRGLVTLFVLALIVAVALPLWAVKGLFLDNQTAMAAQSTAQTQATKALELALREVADSSRALREELSRARAAVPVPAVAAPEVRPVPPPDSAPETVPPPPPAAAPAVTSTPPEKATAEPVAVKAGLATTNPAAPPVAPTIPTNAPAESVATDLEQQLRLIEKSIAEKQRQLQQKTH